MVKSAFLRDHTKAHVEAMEKDGGRTEGQLRNFEEYSSLYDEIDSLGTSTTLLQRREPIKD